MEITLIWSWFPFWVGFVSALVTGFVALSAIAVANMRKQKKGLRK